MATIGGKDVAEMADEAREALHQAQDEVEERCQDVRGYARAADASIREFARERPMVAIACAIGIGFLIGRLASRA